MPNKMIKKSIELTASAENVRDVLTQDECIKLWCAPFSEGTYAIADWKQGGLIQRKVDDSVCVQGVLTTFDPPHQMVMTFFEGNEQEGFSTTLGKSSESYEIIAGEKGRVTLRIVTGPFTEKERKQWGTKLDTSRDEALTCIQGLAR